MNAPLEIVLSEYRRRLEEIYGPRLVGLVLYGSRARGDARPDSDIDVMIVLAPPLKHWEEMKRTSRLTSELSIKYDTVISREFSTAADIDDNPSTYYQNVRREGVTV
jgi:predicted nucleotidyltransferase